MGFVRIFWRNNVEEAYLPKMSILVQILSEIVAIYAWVEHQKNLEEFYGVFEV